MGLDALAHWALTVHDQSGKHAQRDGPLDVSAAESLPVRIAPVPDCNDVDCPGSVRDAVDHPVVANPNAPKVAGALDLSTTVRARLQCERLDRVEHAEGNSTRKSLEVFPRGSCEGDGVLSHEADAPEP